MDSDNNVPEGHQPKRPRLDGNPHSESEYSSEAVSSVISQDGTVMDSTFNNTGYDQNGGILTNPEVSYGGGKQGVDLGGESTSENVTALLAPDAADDVEMADPGSNPTSLDATTCGDVKDDAESPNLETIMNLEDVNSSDDPDFVPESPTQSDSGKSGGTDVTDMRVGEEYQAIMMDMEPVRKIQKLRSTVIWAPDKSMMDLLVDDFCQLVQASRVTTSEFSREYALLLLYQNNYSIPDALSVLLDEGGVKEGGIKDWNRTPVWTKTEAHNFEEGFSLYGKQYHLIQKKVETKTVQEIVQYYYKWKKIENSKYRYLLGAQQRVNRNVVRRRDDSKEKITCSSCGELALASVKGKTIEENLCAECGTIFLRTGQYTPDKAKLQAKERQEREENTKTLKEEDNEKEKKKTVDKKEDKAKPITTTLSKEDNKKDEPPAINPIDRENPPTPPVVFSMPTEPNELGIMRDRHEQALNAKHCAGCGTNNTVVWRHGLEHSIICNDCYVRFVKLKKIVYS